LDGWKRCEIGIHTSIAGSYLNALEAARKWAATPLQIFRRAADVAGRLGACCRGGRAGVSRAREETAAGALVVHANYLINLASAERMLQTRSIQAFHDEIVACAGARGGFSGGASGARERRRRGRRFPRSWSPVKQASKRAPMGELRILIENSAGMGTAVGSRLEEVAEILAGLRGLPVEVCLDTAHLFAAGYDIRARAGWLRRSGRSKARLG